MTETTQPDPQVVAWMREHMRDNPGADSAVALLAYLRHYDGALAMFPDRDVLLASARAANKPLTVADIPAGQGPASLYVDAESTAIRYRTTSGQSVVVPAGWVAFNNDERDALNAALSALAATLPTVTESQP